MFKLTGWRLLWWVFFLPCFLLFFLQLFEVYALLCMLDMERKQQFAVWAACLLCAPHFLQSTNPQWKGMIVILTPKFGISLGKIIFDMPCKSLKRFRNILSSHASLPPSLTVPPPFFFCCPLNLSLWWVVCNHPRGRCAFTRASVLPGTVRPLMWFLL